MPRRFVSLANNEIYHVFNRGINKQTIFSSQRDYQRMLEVMQYYSYKNPPLKYSKYIKLTPENKAFFLEKLEGEHAKIVEIIAYCLMPNHFHFLLRQLEENGISTFLGNIQNSYTRYFNTKYTKIGPLLQGRFKAVLIESIFQLLHVSRYIHLNPHTAHICETFDQLMEYPWSSFPEYLDRKSSICKKEAILGEFTQSSYKEFVLEQADYQRELDIMKHVLLEDE